MSKTFAEALREDRRLVLLRILHEQPSYTMNSSNLHKGLEYYHVPASRDDVITDIHWLGDQGLMKVDELVDGVYGCTLTSRGDDVARGRVTVPGVARPGVR